MKKLFSIILIVSLMMTGSAFAAVDLQPSSSNACTFDVNALADEHNDGLIIHITHAADEEYIQIIFGMQVDYSEDLTAVITDPEGNTHTAEILRRDWSTLEIWTDGLEMAKTHTLTLSGIAAKDALAYPEYAEHASYTVSFITVPPCCV